MASGIGTTYYDWYPPGSIREDLMDFIAQITPTDRPFMTMIGDSKASSIDHQWLRRDIAGRQDNAFIEGSVFGFTANINIPVRERNIVQIFEKEVAVSEEANLVDRAGISDQYSDQVQIRFTELLMDEEHTLLRGSLSTAGTGSARRLKGLFFAISAGSNVCFATGMTLTETNLNDFFARQWQLGVRPRDSLVNAGLKRRISGFTTTSTPRFRDQNDLSIVNVVTIYESDFGVVEFQLSRDVPEVSSTVTASTGFLVIFDREYYKKAWLRPITTRRTADRSDSIEGVVIGSATLEYGHPSAGGLLFGLL